MGNPVCTTSDMFFTLQVYRKYGKEYGEKTNPNISYQFYIPTRNSNLTNRTPKGKWIVFTTPCSVSCGPGEYLLVKKKEHTTYYNVVLNVPIHFVMFMDNLIEGVPKVIFSF